MILILNGASFWVFLLATAAYGIGQGFMYSSHLFYVVSRAKNRSSKMVVHEIAINVGFVIGAIAAGYLGGHFGRYVPYLFGCGALGIGFLAQIGVWFLCKARLERAGDFVKE